MDERTHTSYREDVHSLIVATTSPFYTENKPALKDLFEKSLLVKRGQYSLYDIQFEILGHIIATDSARRKYLRQRGRFARAIRSLAESGAPVERIKLAQERFQTMGDYAAAARLFLGQLRSIGDGLAWWFLNYDRAILRLLAEHAYIQAPEQGIGLYSEIEKCANLAAQGQPFLLNSITNFLRFGDITTYDKSKDRFKLIEVKAGKLQTLSTMRQAKQLALVQEAIETGSHSEFAGVTITEIMAEEPLLTYLKIFERAMAEAKQNIASSRVFGNYLSFGIFYLSEVGKLSEKEADRIYESIDKRCDSIRGSKTDIIIPFMTCPHKGYQYLS